MKGTWWLLLSALLFTSHGGVIAAGIAGHASADQDGKAGSGVAAEQDLEEHAEDDVGEDEEEDMDGVSGEEEVEDGDGQEGEEGEEDEEGEEGDEAESLMQEVDSDKDGKLSLAELHDSMHRESLQEQEGMKLSQSELTQMKEELETTKGHLAKFFKAADVNKDGFVDSTEVPSLLQALNQDDEGQEEEDGEGADGEEEGEEDGEEEGGETEGEEDGEMEGEEDGEMEGEEDGEMENKEAQA